MIQLKYPKGIFWREDLGQNASELAERVLQAAQDIKRAHSQGVSEEKLSMLLTEMCARCSELGVQEMVPDLRDRVCREVLQAAMLATPSACGISGCPVNFVLAHAGEEWYQTAIREEGWGEIVTPAVFCRVHGFQPSQRIIFSKEHLEALELGISIVGDLVVVTLPTLRKVTKQDPSSRQS